MKKTIDRWFSDPDTWVGVFENHDLGSRDVGLRCAFPFALTDGSFEKAEIGKTHAPDGKTIGLGWRYILVAKCRTTAEALRAMATCDSCGLSLTDWACTKNGCHRQGQPQKKEA